MSTPSEATAPILLLAESGFIIRNLLLGTFADTVMRRRPLLVAVRNPGDPRLLKLARGRPLELIKLIRPVVEPPRSRLGKLGSWPVVLFHLQTGSKNTRGVKLARRVYDTGHSRAGATAIKLLTAAGWTLRRLGLQGFVERRYLASVARWPETVAWRNVLANQRPAAMVSTLLTLTSKYQPSPDLAAVVAAHELGIPCGTLIQSWDNLTTKTGVLPPWLDRYWSWSERMNRELARLYPWVPRRRIRVVGGPQFDFHRRPELREPREVFAGRLGLDPERPWVVAGTGTPLALPDEPRAILELARALRGVYPRCQVLVRLHPKDDGDRWGPLYAKLRELDAVLQHTAPEIHMDRGGFVPPEDFYRDQINALAHAAVVVNSSSTLTVDAAIIDRPVVCLAYDARVDPRFPEGRARSFARSSHYAPLAATGGVVVCTSREEAVAAIGRYLDDPDLDRDKRREIVRLVTGKADGGAGERLAAEALEMAERKAV